MSEYPLSACEIGELVIEEAMDIFCECQAESDFCVQHVGQCVVFGGSNRLIFSVKTGFRPDRSYCSARFLENWDKKYGNDGSTPTTEQTPIESPKVDSCKHSSFEAPTYAEMGCEACKQSIRDRLKRNKPLT